MICYLLCTIYCINQVTSIHMCVCTPFLQGGVNAMGAATVAPLTHWKGQLSLLLCDLVLSCWRKRPWSPTFWQHCHQTLKTCETVVYVTVCSEFLYVLKRNGVDMIFPRNRQTFSLVHYMILWVLGVGTHQETAILLAASWFPDHIKRSKF